jgi:hypothetical protein
MAAPALKQHSDWPELLSSLFERMTEHDTEVEFVNLEVNIPVTSEPDTKHAPWRLNGVIRVRNERNGR